MIEPTCLSGRRARVGERIARTERRSVRRVLNIQVEGEYNADSSISLSVLPFPASWVVTDMITAPFSNIRRTCVLFCVMSLRAPWRVPGQARHPLRGAHPPGRGERLRGGDRLYYIILYYIILYYIILHHVINLLYYIILYYIILHYIISIHMYIYIYIYTYYYIIL